MLASTIRLLFAMLEQLEQNKNKKYYLALITFTGVLSQQAVYSQSLSKEKRKEILVSFFETVFSLDKYIFSNYKNYKTDVEYTRALSPHTHTVTLIEENKLEELCLKIISLVKTLNSENIIKDTDLVNSKGEKNSPLFLYLISCLPFFFN